MSRPLTLVVIVIAGVVVAVATVPPNPFALTTDALVTVPDPAPAEYCGTFSTLPTKVAAPLVPVVVRLIGA